MRRSNLRDVACLFAACAAIVLGGCISEVPTNSPPATSPNADEPADSPPEPTAPPEAKPASTSTPAKQRDITLEVVDKEGFQRALDKHRGEIVLVDVWATWCAPCKEMFPHTVALHNKYANKEVAVISLSMDDADAHEDALKFLQEQKATFTNLRSKHGAEEEAIEAFDIDGGALPHFKLYDREGKPVKKLTSGEGAVPPEAADIERAVEQLLSKPAK